MTEISIERLERVIANERYVEQLKNKLDHPDYWDEGMAHAHHIPVSDQVNIDAWDREQILCRVEQAELSSIFTFFIGMAMTISFTLILILTFLWNNV